MVRLNVGIQKSLLKLRAYLSNKYDIVIFGGPNEKKIAEDIEKY